jgi:hypothetical protein
MEYAEHANRTLGRVGLGLIIAPMAVWMLEAEQLSYQWLLGDGASTLQNGRVAGGPVEKFRQSPVADGRVFGLKQPSDGIAVQWIPFGGQVPPLPLAPDRP